MTAADIEPGSDETSGPRASMEIEGVLGKLHLWGAMLGIGLQPISTATGNIGFAIAIGTALPRVPANLPALRDLTRQRWLHCLVAWMVLTWCSLLWSPDPTFGFEQFRASRVLLWIPVLWPLRDRWSHLVGAILAGVGVMVAIQCGQMAWGWPASRWSPGSGLTTPTQTGLWAAVALSFWLILIVAGTMRQALFGLPIAAITGVGLVWSATRASVIGLMAELVFANLVLAFTSPGWARRALLRGVVGVVILGAALLMAPTALHSKVRQAVSETASAVRGGQPSTDQDRLAMWRMAVGGWWNGPAYTKVVGVGSGGVPSIAERTSIQVAEGDLRKIRMIHSTYIQTLVETGCVGLAMLLAFVTLLLRAVLSSVRTDPLYIASFGALVVWFVAAAFDGYQQSGGFLSVGAILMPLALADLRKTPVEAGH